jgi:hypothetical protein
MTEVIQCEPYHQVVHDKWVIGLLVTTLLRSRLEKKKVVALVATWLTTVLPKVYPVIGDPEITMGILKDYSSGAKIDVDEAVQYAQVHSCASDGDTHSQRFTRPCLSYALRAMLAVSDKEASECLAQAILQLAYAHCDLESGDNDKIMKDMRQFLLTEIVPAIQKLLDEKEAEIMASRAALST